MPGRFQRLDLAIDVAHAGSMFWLAAVDGRPPRPPLHPGAQRRRPANRRGPAARGAAALTRAARRRAEARRTDSHADEQPTRL